MRLLPAVQSALGSISAAWEDIEETQQRKILRVGALPTFASYWLIPRIAEFRATHRGIELEIQSLPSDFVNDNYFPKLDSVGVDVAFTYGGGAWTGMQSRRLFDERMQVACSPHYLASHPLVNLKDLATCTLIQHTTRPNMWREWSSVHGPSDLRTVDGPRFEHFFMIAQAARDSIGVALLPEFVVEREVQNGSLLRPFANHLSTGMSYHVVWPKATEDSALLRALLEWLAGMSLPSNSPI
jgi:LysR family glycine cleavage system transcriptional activator